MPLRWTVGGRSNDEVRGAPSSVVRATGRGGSTRGPWRRRTAGVLAGVALAATALAACGSAGSPLATKPASASPVKGGTAVLALTPGEVPNYIFPFVSGATNTVVNTANLQYLMYRPLYWFGVGNSSVALNTSESLAAPPVYSDGYRTVTIHLRNFRWSDGVSVTSRDVVFWMNLLKANKTDWASYIPGEFPDNVASTVAAGPSTVVLHLIRAYNPEWFTNNELSQIIPIPQQVWDRTSTSGKVGDWDLTTSGARAVYKYLNAESEQLSTYATNPLWQVVDGPWKLKSFNADGHLSFVPNPGYSGAPKARLASFVEVPFTSTAAEFSDLASGHSGISVGYLPLHDLPAQSQLTAAGYRLVRAASYAINFIQINFDNPTVGPLFRQLYVRQALQRVMDQPGQVQAFLHGIGGYPDYGPIPPLPSSPYLSPVQEKNPYPFSITAARQLLTTHGWSVPASGPATCTDPGTGPAQCGAGVRAGQALSFNLLYASGSDYLANELANYQSDAARAGIVLNLKSESFNSVIGAISQCSPHQADCSWQLGTWGIGGAWLFGNDPYPSGEQLFSLGSNTGSWVDPTAERLIQATNFSPGTANMRAYDAYLSVQLPVIFQLCAYSLNEVASNLRGVSFLATGNLTPENWYFVK